MTTLMACSNAIAPREQQVGAAVLGARGCRRRGREWGTKRDLTGKFLSKTTGSHRHRGSGPQSRRLGAWREPWATPATRPARLVQGC